MRVRVLVIRLRGEPEVQTIDAEPGEIRALVGGVAQPLPVDLAERFVLYVVDPAPEEINLRATLALRGDVRGTAVLAALRPLGGLDDLSDGEIAMWRARLLAPSSAPTTREGERHG